MDTSTHTTVSVPTTSHADDIFEFFSLPRELRDMIYDHLWQEVEEGTEDLCFNICTPILEPRLVNRQFKIECDERIAANNHRNEATVTQHYDASPFDTSNARFLPRLAARSTSLTINLVNRDKDCGACHTCHSSRCSHSMHYMEWVDHWLLYRGPLQKLNVNMSIASRRCVPEATANHRIIVQYLKCFAESGALRILGPGSERDAANETVLLATYSGSPTRDRKAAMAEVAKVVAEVHGKSFWMW